MDWVKLFGPRLEKGQTPSDAVKKKIVKHFKEVVYEDLIERGLVERGETPSLYKLRKTKGKMYEDFLGATRQRGLNWNDIITLSGLVPLQADWVKLFGPRLEKGQAPDNTVKKKIVKHFKEVVYKDLIERGLVKRGETPIIDVLKKPSDKEKKYSDFLNAAWQRGLKWNDIITLSELKPSQMDRIKLFGARLEKGQTPSDAVKKKIVKYFKEVVYEDLIERGLVKRGETPSLYTKGKMYDGFLSAAWQRGLKWNDIITLSGLVPLQMDWVKLFGPRLEKGQTPSDTIKKKIVKYFKEVVYEDLIERGLVKRGDAPSVWDLKKPEDNEKIYTNFLNAIVVRGLKWSDIVISSNLKPTPKTRPPSKLVFQFDPTKIKGLSNKLLSKILWQYFTYIENNKGMVYSTVFKGPRKHASQLQYMGSRNFPIYTSSIIDYFIKKKGLIKKVTFKKQFYEGIIRHSRLLYEKLEKESLGVSGHEQMAKHFLVYHPNTVAIETPVWKEIKSKVEKFFTGHIDILLVNKDKIIISDFKPGGEREIFSAIPQLTAYGILLKAQLDEIYGDDILNKIKIICLGFNKLLGYYFNPFDVKEHIIPFLSYEKGISKRKIDIESKASESLFKDDFKLILFLRCLNDNKLK